MNDAVGDSNTTIFMGDLKFAGSKIPECDIRSWVPHSASVPGKHFDRALLTRAQKAYKECRICLVSAPSKYAQLYQGFVDELLQKDSNSSDLVQASYSTDALGEFRIGISLNLPTLLRGRPSTVTNKSVVIDIMEVGAHHRSLFDSIIDDSHPAALGRLTRDLRARNIRLLFIADEDLLARPATAADIVCEIDPLSATRNEILDAYAANGLSADRVDRIISKRLIGDDSAAIADYLHGLHIEGKLLETIFHLEEELKSGDPRKRWAGDTKGRLFPVTDSSIFHVRDKRKITHNEALVEVGRVTIFLFSLFESLTLDEFETLFKTIVAPRGPVEKIDLEYYEQGEGDREAASGIIGEKARYRVTNASLLEEYEQSRDSLFKELSIRRNQQTARYAFSLPYMREGAAALLGEELPIGPHGWFNRLVVDTPTLFSANDHVARRLIECYADWLSAQPPENVRDFSLVGWWSLAAQIAQLGYQKATEGIEDKGLLLVVGFLSEQAAIHSFVSRVCLFFQSLMLRPNLEHLVTQALNDLINKRGWKIALGVCRTLQSEPRFDVFKWIVQLVDRGDAATRDEAAWLLSRYVEKALRERKNTDEVLSRIEGHLPVAGQPPRPSQLVAYSFIQRLVFEKSSRMKQSDYKVGALIAPFFVLNDGNGTPELAPGIATTIRIMLQTADRDVVEAEAKATAEALQSIWFTDLPESEQKRGALKQAFDRITAEYEGADILKGAVISLVLIEAIHCLRRTTREFAGSPIEVERELMRAIEAHPKGRIKYGIGIGATACASATVGIDELDGRYNTAERLEKWAQRQ